MSFDRMEELHGLFADGRGETPDDRKALGEQFGRNPRTIKLYHDQWVAAGRPNPRKAAGAAPAAAPVASSVEMSQVSAPANYAGTQQSVDLADPKRVGTMPTGAPSLILPKPGEIREGAVAKVDRDYVLIELFGTVGYRGGAIWGKCSRDELEPRPVISCQGRINVNDLVNVKVLAVNNNQAAERVYVDLSIRQAPRHQRGVATHDAATEHQLTAPAPATAGPWPAYPAGCPCATCAREWSCAYRGLYDAPLELQEAFKAPAHHGLAITYSPRHVIGECPLYLPQGSNK